MPYYRFLIVDVVQRLVSFSIPSAAAIACIASYAPICECGAGTGYWSSLLRQQGVDVVAYDAEPPDASFSNSFFDCRYTNVLRGSGTELFSTRPCELARRSALLLVWPNNPDAVDNRHLSGMAGLSEDGVAKSPLWDAECAACYLDAGGQTILYVGEREETLDILPGARPESGTSGSRALQNLLRQRCDLVERVDLPHWWFERVRTPRSNAERETCDCAAACHCPAASC